jgi:hypothetical protein
MAKYCFVFGYGDVYGDVCFIEANLDDILDCLTEDELEVWGNMGDDMVTVLFDGDGHSNDWEKNFTVESFGFKQGDFKVVKYGSLHGMNGFVQRLKEEIKSYGEDLANEEEME